LCLRDAILRLEQIGLVRRLPHRGAVVADLTLRELAHIYATRLVLEVEATRTGNEVLSAGGGARMRADHERMIEAVYADVAPLTIIYAAGGNRVLLGIVRDLWRRCRPYKIAHVRRSREIGDLTVWSFQGRLTDAASAHDVHAAVEVTHQSLISSTERLRSLLAAEAAQPDGH
jgi:DNA-binding GntR family transcriptional regulator